MPSSSLLRLSRPRFWPYEAGTFAIGVAAAAVPAAWSSPLAWVFLWYFLFPANLLIYGVNDIHDYETDRNNPKKSGYEDLLPPERHAWAWRGILLTNVPFLLAAPFLPVRAALALAAFVILAVGYSAPPVRAKARPFLDSLFSAGHYVATGVFGFLLAAPYALPDALTVVAALSWCVAMHAYSAVPDIRSDREAGLSTAATVLGANGTLALCLALYVFAALATWAVLGWVALVFGALYAGLTIASFGRDEASLLRLYRCFPFINAAAGATILFACLRFSFPLLA